MTFEDCDDGTCMHDVAVSVADQLREPLRELFFSQHRRAQELDGGLENATLAGLTLLWLESVHAVFGTTDYESAIRLVSEIRPDDKRVCREMSQAACDFLRRSQWMPVKKRRKK